LVPRNICNPLFFLYLINKVNAFMYVTQKDYKESFVNED